MDRDREVPEQSGREYRAAWARDVRAGRALPLAGDLFDRPEDGVLPGLPLFDSDRCEPCADRAALPEPVRHFGTADGATLVPAYCGAIVAGWQVTMEYEQVTCPKCAAEIAADDWATRDEALTALERGVRP